MPRFDHLFKIVVIGDSGSGKSSLTARFTEDRFDQDAPTTVGVDFATKTMFVGTECIKLTIWDTAGQERFRTLTASYYRGCHGVILAFDVNVRSSFESLSREAVVHHLACAPQR